MYPGGTLADEQRGWQRVLRGLEWAALVAAALFIVLFLVVAGLRVGYPYELEWMEGGSLSHVQRVLTGQPLYVPPGLDFTPYIYTPLYYWVAAGASSFLGDGFGPLRLVSVLSALGCFLLLFALVRREASSWQTGLLAAGLFAATYEAGGAWLDLARVDSLFLLFILAGVYVARCARGAPGLAAAGFLFGVAFLAKQTALIIALPIVLWTLLAHRGAARAAFATGVFLVVGGGTLMLDWYSDGWSTYYLFTLPRYHDVVASMAVSFWTADVLRPLGLAMLATVAFLAGARRDQRLFFGLLLAALVAASYSSRLHEGGYVNVLLPAYAGLAVGFALGVQRLKAWAARQELRIQALLALAVLVQFAALLYNPIRQVPTDADRAAGDYLVEVIRAVPGEVLVLAHPYLAERAGKRGHAQQMALHDVFRGTPEGRERIQDELRAAIRSRRFGAVVLNVSWEAFPDDFGAHYCAAGPIFNDHRVFWPVTGHQTRPARLYLPCE